MSTLFWQVWEHDLDPVLVQLGPLRVGWYGLMYATTFLVFYWMMVRASRRPGALVPREEVSNLLTYGIIGVIAGGRLGWVIIYGGSEYLAEPWRVLETWKGGMSFHGGLLGVTAAVIIYARRHGLSPIALADRVVIWAALGVFLGRLGNFINGELYGLPTDGTWGVIFSGDPQRVPRHPSQLYEAVGEGLLLFLVMLALRRWVPWHGMQPAVFCLGYGIARSIAELVRLPDAHIGYLLHGSTMGQWLSVPMVIVGAIWVTLVVVKHYRGRGAESE